MTKTVFILGAGSSASYGFPTGYDLLKIIIDGERKIPIEYHLNSELQDEAEKFRIFNEYYKLCLNYYSNNINNSFNIKTFQKNLKLSGAQTIDTYLSSNSRSVADKEFGKYVISSIISFYENTDQVEKNHEDNWIDYFLNHQISYQLEKFKEEPPQIITFNYDSLFEHKLALHLEKQHGENEAIEYIRKNLVIKHVYGKLKEERYPQRSFTIKRRDKNGNMIKNPIPENVDFNRIYEESKNIDFIRGEINETDVDENILDYRTMLYTASNIYILGYGFDKFNNQILFKSSTELNRGKDKIHYTHFGLEDALIKKLNNFQSISTSEITNKGKCLDLLKRAMPPKLFP